MPTSAGGIPTVQAVVLRALARHQDRPCLRWEGGQANYAETRRRVRALAAWMQERSDPGARVGILLHNGREYVESILACAAAGRVRVPLNERETGELNAKKIEAVGISILVTSGSGWEEVAPHLQGRRPTLLLVEGAGGYEEACHAAVGGALSPTEPGSLYRLSFTGGTTGTAKAVMQTHVQELAMMRNLLLEVMQPSAQTAFVAATPLAHASGAFVVPTILGGGSVTWTSRFDPERLVSASWLGEDLRLQTFLVPTALGDVAQAAPERHALDSVIYGGAPCPRPTLEAALAQLGQCLVQVYGQAEAPMTICILDKASHADLDAIDGSVGNPFLHVDVRIEVDGAEAPEGTAGEVVVRAEHVMSGYWGHERETAERLTPDGGLLTQDLGYLDANGRLRLVGRSRELIISGGFNVYPDDVERRLGALPGIQQLAVFGVNHPRWGEAVVVAVTGDGITASDSPAVLESLRPVFNQRLANYEVPKAVVVVDRLPLTSVGKVSRKDLANRHADLFGQSSKERT